MRPGEAFEPPYFRPRFFGAGLANGNSGLIEALSASASGSRVVGGASALCDRFGLPSDSGSLSTNLIAIAVPALVPLTAAC